MRIRSDQRQHLRISKEAFEQLVEDAIVFGNKSVHQRKTTDEELPKANISGMINHLFLQYYERAEASISIVAEKRKNKLRETICRQNYLNNNPWDKDLEMYYNNQITDESTNSFIETVVNAEIEEILGRIRAYPKDITLKIRLQNETNDILYPEETDYSAENRNDTPWAEQRYYKSRGQYIGAVIEEYARKTRYEREHIYFADLIERINNNSDGTDGQRVITIEYVTAAGDLIKSDVKVYRLTKPSESEYHYLIGYSKKAGETKKNYSIGIFRLDRILGLKVRPESFGSGKITKAEKAVLEKDINAKGIQFLIERNEQFVVAFTEKGLKKYNNQIHLRPAMVKIDPPKKGKRIAYFDCTPSQIRYYFFEFGKDAIIVSPEYLREEFKNGYADAASEYSSR